MAQKAPSISTFLCKCLYYKRPAFQTCLICLKLITDEGVSGPFAFSILHILFGFITTKSFFFQTALLRGRAVCWESPHLHPKQSVNVVGTGKNKTKSLNVSTTTSFLLSIMDWTILKHGGSRVSSKSGSADVLRKLRAFQPNSWVELLMSPTETKMGWLTQDPSLRFAQSIRLVRRKAPQSFWINLIMASLNLPNASCCFVGTSQHRTLRLMTLTSSSFCSEKLGCTAGLADTDKLSSDTPSLLVGLTANQLTKSSFCFEMVGVGLECPSFSDSTNNQHMFSQTILQILCGLKRTIVLLISASAALTAKAIHKGGEGLLFETAILQKRLGLGEASNKLKCLVQTNAKTSSSFLTASNLKEKI
ncbi:anthranilate phosphoribosyltransferase [Candidatus Tremblaya phenacola PAVE]|nr:anthranilate phosphoribosyltransferase [Candidatus Tremblaya phenacola PAVE]